MKTIIAMMVIALGLSACSTAQMAEWNEGFARGAADYQKGYNEYQERNRGTHCTSFVSGNIVNTTCD